MFHAVSGRAPTIRGMERGICPDMPLSCERSCPQMPLIAPQIRAFAPAATPYKKTDERGLYLEVFPNGSKLWRLKYYVAGKEKRIALGAWPEVTLQKARHARDELPPHSHKWTSSPKSSRSPNSSAKCRTVPNGKPSTTSKCRLLPRPRNARRPRIGNSHRELKPRAKLSCRVPITGSSCSRLVSRSRS